MIYKTAILSLIKDENKYIDKWLKYHFDLGIDKIYLFEDFNSKSHYTECIKYGDTKIRLLKLEKYINASKYEPSSIRQIQLLDFFIKKNPEKMDWVIFMDPDEYIVLDKTLNLQSFLTKFKDYPAVYLQWKMYNANKHLTYQENDIESYTQVTNASIDNYGFHRHKSFINLNKNPKIYDQHTILDGVTTTFKKSFLDKDMSFRHARLNHYFTRSWEDWLYQIYHRGDLRIGNRKVCDFFDLNNDMLDQKEELLKPLIGKKIPGDIWLDKNGLLYNGIRITNKHEKMYLDNYLWFIGPKKANQYLDILYNNQYKNPKMKLAFMYFCYDKDNDMLNMSIKCIDKLRQKYDIDVYLIDDANHPIKDIPENTTYWQTTFDRHVNLNGPEALNGVIECYGKIFDVKKYDWVIKVDPDTIINKLDEFENIDPNIFCNIGCGNHPLKTTEFKEDINNIPVYGCMHGISYTGYQNILKNISKLNKNKYIRLQEDLFVAILACNNNCDLNYYVYNFNNNPNICSYDRGVYFDYQMPLYKNTNLNMPYDKLLQFNCVTFKPLSWFNADKTVNTKDELRSIAEERMKKYMEWFIKT